MRLGGPDGKIVDHASVLDAGVTTVVTTGATIVSICAMQKIFLARVVKLGVNPIIRENPNLSPARQSARRRRSGNEDHDDEFPYAQMGQA
jgi:hypothetical protein